MYLSRFFLFGGLVFLLSSCGAYKSGKPSDRVKQEVTSKILFISYSTSMKNDNIHVEVTAAKTVLGSFKEKRFTKKQDDNWICYQIDTENKVLDSLIIDNPLHKTIEYSDDIGKLYSKQLNLEIVNFTLRLQLHQNSKVLKLYDEGKSLLNRYKL